MRSVKAVPYALGAFVLGVLGVISGDFAFQWQPVPEHVPLRSVLASVSAVAMAGAALAAVLPRAAREGRLLLAIFFGVWAVLLHGPHVAAKPGSVAEWLGVAESTAMAAGGVALFAETLEAKIWRRRLTFSARIAFGLCLLVFGLAHFVYLAFTAQMVPAWLPWRTGWAAATGAGHVLAGLAFLFNRGLKAAGPAVTGMMASFVVLLHTPRVIAEPTSRMEWTMMAVALTLTGAAFALWRRNVEPEPESAEAALPPEPPVQ
ncbi:hypothetical protein [Caulobacter sp. 1776]|uniref:hypothetical protein n=1 Tax=Caulobacter sp. 1776 TaxID=3156420 RepID=UPI0033919AB4